MKPTALHFLAVTVLVTASASAAPYQVLHSFVGGPSDGRFPQGTMDTDGTRLYGASSEGGSNGFGGAVYAMNLDGTGFSLLASMASPPNTANGPLGGVTLLGSTLYGTSFNSGVGQFGGNGTVFSVGTDGSNMHDVHAFSNSEGSKPDTPLFHSGSALYGTVPKSETDNNWGSVFKVTSSSYQVLHSFTGTATTAHVRRT